MAGTRGTPARGDQRGAGGRRSRRVRGGGARRAGVRGRRDRRRPSSSGPRRDRRSSAERCSPSPIPSAPRGWRGSSRPGRASTARATSSSGCRCPRWSPSPGSTSACPSRTLEALLDDPRHEVRLLALKIMAIECAARRTHAGASSGPARALPAADRPREQLGPGRRQRAGRARARGARRPARRRAVPPGRVGRDLGAADLDRRDPAVGPRRRARPHDRAGRPARWTTRTTSCTRRSAGCCERSASGTRRGCWRSSTTAPRPCRAPPCGTPSSGCRPTSRAHHLGARASGRRRLIGQPAISSQCGLVMMPTTLPNGSTTEAVTKPLAALADAVVLGRARARAAAASVPSRSSTCQ